jgi:1-acyl-sn-glycerol-3-phosphate acyltransferase
MSKGWGEQIKEIIYRVCIPLLALFLKVLFRLEIRGRENVPQDRGTLLVARHRSYWDIPILLAALGARRRIYFIARHTLLKNPFFHPFVKHFAIPVNREHFGIEDFRKIVRAIEEDKIVGIFPEGTTRPTDEVRVGVIRFAERSGKPFLPVRLEPIGPYPPDYPFGFPRVQVWIGEPISLAELQQEAQLTGRESRAARYEKLARALMARIDRTGIRGPQGAL